MASEPMRATGGFVPPSPSYSFAVPALRIALRDMPSFSALRGGIDFRPPEVRWARERELELRRLTQMWQWP